MTLPFSPALIIATLATVLFTGLPAGAQDLSVAADQSSFDARQTSDIETIVHDYLVAHPEVLIEAMNSLEAKQAADQAASQKEAIATAGAELVGSPDGTVLGNPDGDVTVVEFFDYNCGFCKRALGDMDALIEADKNVRFVLKEIAVLGPQSVEASHVSLALRQIDPTKYAEFHRQLLSSKGVADEARAIALAAGLGVSESDIREAIKSEAVQTVFNASNALAGSLAINGTPSYVIGDQVLPGAIGVESLAATIANVRACGSASCPG